MFGVCLLIAELEQNRRYQRSNDNDQYDRREHVRVDQTGLLALLCYDQRNLTARYHAQTDGECIISLEAMMRAPMPQPMILVRIATMVSTTAKIAMVLVRPSRLVLYR